MAAQLVLVERFLDIFFPKKCVGCRKEGFWLCDECGANVVEGAEVRVDGGAVSSLYGLENRIVREAVHNLKYNGVFDLADELVRLTSGWCNPGDIFPSDSVLVPVPTAVRRERQRGYNQAGLLATAFGRWADVPVVDDLLLKREVKTQVGKDAGAREASLQGAFRVANIEKLAALTDKHVVIIDDVYTTGSTVRAVSEVLRVAGLSRVSSVVLARTD